MATINRILDSPKSIWIVLLIHCLMWLSAGLILDIHPDMVDHWVWSRFLTFGYYEHPPMVAVTMRLATLIGGSNPLTLKVGSILFSAAILYLCFQTGRLFFNSRVGLIFVLILESTPYFSTGSVFWHIDQPYMVCWVSGLYVIGRYIRSRNLNWMFAFGIIAGFGAMSKYIMILFPVCLAIWCLVNREGRKLLSGRQTYLAALVAIVIVLPNIYWNYSHDWVTFNFTLEKGLKGARFGEHFLHFFVSQLVLFSVFYSIYLWWNLFRRRISRSLLFDQTEEGAMAWTFLLITGLLPMAFFGVTSFAGSRTDPHWVNIAYFSLFLLLAGYIETRLAAGHHRFQIKFFFTAYLFNLLLALFVVVQIVFMVISIDLPDAPSLKVLIGWDETADQIETIFEEKEIPLPAYIIAREYQMSSALSFYLKNQPWPHSIEKKLRNVWSPVPEVKKRGAALVCRPGRCQKRLAAVRFRFQREFSFLGEVRVYKHGKRVRELDVFYMKPME